MVRVDLRYERAYQDPKVLSEFISSQIDLLCISVGWGAQFRRICDYMSQLPPEVCTIVGGYKATQEVEYLFERCPNIDMIVRGEGEEIIKQIVTGVPYKDDISVVVARSCFNYFFGLPLFLYRRINPL